MGLLVFKKDKDVQDRLKKLDNHPNEIIQDIIKKEFRNTLSNGFDPAHITSPNFMKNTVDLFCNKLQTSTDFICLMISLFLVNRI